MAQHHAATLPSSLDRPQTAPSERATIGEFPLQYRSLRVTGAPLDRSKLKRTSTDVSWLTLMIPKPPSDVQPFQREALRAGLL